MNSKIIAGIPLLVVALNVAMTSSAMAADDGKSLYTAKSCITCHGDEGKAPIVPTYPKLNGQNKEYLVAQIKMIKDGTRSGGGTAAMKAMTSTLTDDEIESISTYLSEVE